ncbi:MAG TPA: NADH-quinone oxidoreductase subunit C [Gallionellaceae bacterium]|nr:NADH-quinone oxidoreductase subunit C [Gallionellaceae bacterium]
MADLNLLGDSLRKALGGQAISLDLQLGELTLVLRAADMLAVLTRLRDDPLFHFEQLTDLCGIDYSSYGSDVCEDGAYLPGGSAAAHPHRFAVIYQLLSFSNNVRLRVRVHAEDDAMPMLPTVVGIWPGANWYEREAFDLYGIIFSGHPDLRRLLTDYGFIGNPFRKDFPLSGHVEMRYDPEQKRVIYQPVTVEPRQITPRIVREEQYGRLK